VHQRTPVEDKNQYSQLLGIKNFKDDLYKEYVSPIMMLHNIMATSPIIGIW
jgi:hypothetical protein